MFLALLCTSLAIFYTSGDGSESNLCPQTNPCSYKRVLKVATAGSNVTIIDKYIENTHKLEQLRIMLLELLHNQVSIDGGNITINGSNLRPVWHAFLVGYRSNFTTFANFHFTAFKTPICVFNSCHNFTLANITYSGNHIVGGISLLSIAFSDMQTENVNFFENSVENTSLLLFSTATFEGRNTKFERNWAVHNSSQPLVRCLNSILYFTKWIFRNNHSPFSPLILFDYRTFLFNSMSLIELNHNSDIIACDGMCNMSFSGTVFRYNKGVMILAISEPGIYFHLCEIYGNSAQNEPLLMIPGAFLWMGSGNKIYQNYASTLIETRGEKATAQFYKTSIEDNVVKDSILELGSQSYFYASDCRFAGNFGKEIINGADAEFYVRSTEFARNEGKDLKLEFGSAKIINATFSRDSRKAVRLNHSTIAIFNSTFNGEPANHFTFIEGEQSRIEFVKSPGAHTNHYRFSLPPFRRFLAGWDLVIILGTVQAMILFGGDVLHAFSSAFFARRAEGGRKQ